MIITQITNADLLIVETAGHLITSRFWKGLLSTHHKGKDGRRGRRVISFMSGCLAYSTNWKGSWVGPRVGLDALIIKKILPYWEFNPDHPVHSLVTIHWVIPASEICKNDTWWNCYKFHIQKLYQLLWLYSVKQEERMITEN